MEPSSLFGLSDHLEALSRHGDPLEVLDATVDFEYFRAGWPMGLVAVMGRKAVARRLTPCRCSRR